MINENELAKELGEALDIDEQKKAALSQLKMPPTQQLVHRTHSDRLDELIHELQMTIRILEEAKRRL